MSWALGVTEFSLIFVQHGDVAGKRVRGAKSSEKLRLPRLKRAKMAK